MNVYVLFFFYFFCFQEWLTIWQIIGERPSLRGHTRDIDTSLRRALTNSNYYHERKKLLVSLGCLRALNLYFCLIVCGVCM